MSTPNYDGDHDEGDVELGSGDTLRERVDSFSGDESTCSVSEMRDRLDLDD